MVSLFKQKNSTVVVRLIVLSVVVHLHFFTQPPVVSVPDTGSLMYYILAPLQRLPSIVLSLLFHTVIIIQALRLNYLLHHYRMFPVLDYTPAMCYILLTALLPEWSNIGPELVAAFFILLWIHLFARVISTQSAIRAIFDCGIATGITVMLYPPTAMLIVVGLIAILILRSFRLNEICIYIAGVILPVYFLGSILFLNDRLQWLKNLIPILHFHLTMPADKFTMIMAFILLSLCTLIGFVSMQNHTGKLVISARKLWIIDIVAFVFLVPFILFAAEESWVVALLIAMPFCAALCSNLFYYSKNKIFISLLFWLLLFAGLFHSFGGAALFKK